MMGTHKNMDESQIYYDKWKNYSTEEYIPWNSIYIKYSMVRKKKRLFLLGNLGGWVARFIGKSHERTFWDNSNIIFYILIGAGFHSCMLLPKLALRFMNSIECKVYRKKEAAKILNFS